GGDGRRSRDPPGPDGPRPARVQHDAGGNRRGQAGRAGHTGLGYGAPREPRAEGGDCRRGREGAGRCARHGEMTKCRMANAECRKWRMVECRKWRMVEGRTWRMPEASERSEASRANGASRRSGERDNAWGSPRGDAPRKRMTWSVTG